MSPVSFISPLSTLFFPILVDQSICPPLSAMSSDSLAVRFEQLAKAVGDQPDRRVRDKCAGSEPT